MLLLLLVRQRLATISFVGKESSSRPELQDVRVAVDHRKHLPQSCECAMIVRIA